VVTGELLEPAEQRGADPLAPGGRCDDQLGLGLGLLGRPFQPGVPDQAAGGVPDGDVGATGRAAVGQAQLRLLRHRADAVGRQGVGEQLLHLGDDGGGQSVGDLHAEVVRAGAQVSALS
jgi:hypothetical protein